MTTNLLKSRLFHPMFTLVLGTALLGVGCSSKTGVAKIDTDGEVISSTVSGLPGEKGMMRLSWRLQSQENVLGFNVYRGESADGPFVQANSEIIPGHDTTSIPQTYEYYDLGLELGKEYHFYVNEVTFSGTTDKISPTFGSTAKPRQFYLDKGYLNVPELEETPSQ